MRVQELTKKFYSIENTRAIKVKYIPCTNTRGARVKLTDDYLSERKQSVYLSYDYEVSDVAKQALEFLIDKGFNVVARASNVNEYLFMVNNWNDDYLTLKGDK